MTSKGFPWTCTGYLMRCFSLFQRVFPFWSFHVHPNNNLYPYCITPSHNETKNLREAEPDSKRDQSMKQYL
jgi:hypothetical protein